MTPETFIEFYIMYFTGDNFLFSFLGSVISFLVIDEIQKAKPFITVRIRTPSFFGVQAFCGLAGHYRGLAVRSGLALKNNWAC